MRKGIANRDDNPTRVAGGRDELWAPLPARAISDQRLTRTDLGVLSAICLHDRMSLVRRKGDGCWASHKTLAIECGCNYNNFSTSVSKLVMLDYVTREPYPLNKRQHVYRVLYDSSPGDEVSTSRTREQSSDSSPGDEVSTSRTREQSSDSSPGDDQNSKIVRPQKCEGERDQSLTGVEYIPLKREESLIPENEMIAKFRARMGEAKWKDLFEKAKLEAPTTFVFETEFHEDRARRASEQVLCEFGLSTAVAGRRAA